MTDLTMSYEDNLAEADHIIQEQRKRITELENINEEYKKRVAELHSREDVWFKYKAGLEREVERLKSYSQKLVDSALSENKAELVQEIDRLRSALEMAQQCLRRCGDEWEGLSDSSLPTYIQEHHRKIAAQIGETLQQLEQALKGEE